MAEFTDNYYTATKDLSPSTLLLEALTLLPVTAETALDLGCGAGRDTRLLLEKGFRVTSIDSEPEAQKFMDELHQLGDLTYATSTFADFEYKRYDLVNARYSLPFNPSTSFTLVISTILDSLNPDGIFVGQLFGVNDDWNSPSSNMTFHDRSEVLELFSSLDIIRLDEKDEVGYLADGSKKHWHVFDVIARKK